MQIKLHFIFLTLSVLSIQQSVTAVHSTKEISEDSKKIDPEKLIEEIHNLSNPSAGAKSIIAFGGSLMLLGAGYGTMTQQNPMDVPMLILGTLVAALIGSKVDECDKDQYLKLLQ